MQTLHVAVAVVFNKQQEVLLALRQSHQHQGDLWEFPGGKIGPGEHIFAALQRELKEEVDLTVIDAEPLLKVAHQYEDRDVLLDVWQVTSYSGEVYGREGQQIQWKAIDKLRQVDFPAANQAIVDAVETLTINI